MYLQAEQPADKTRVFSKFGVYDATTKCATIYAGGSKFQVLAKTSDDTESKQSNEVKREKTATGDDCDHTDMDLVGVATAFQDCVVTDLSVVLGVGYHQKAPRRQQQEQQQRQHHYHHHTEQQEVNQDLTTVSMVSGVQSRKDLNELLIRPSESIERIIRTTTSKFRDLYTHRAIFESESLNVENSQLKRKIILNTCRFPISSVGMSVRVGQQQRPRCQPPLSTTPDTTLAVYSRNGAAGFNIFNSSPLRFEAHRDMDVLMLMVAFLKYNGIWGGPTANISLSKFDYAGAFFDHRWGQKKDQRHFVSERAQMMSAYFQCKEYISEESMKKDKSGTKRKWWDGCIFDSNFPFHSSDATIDEADTGALTLSSYCLRGSQNMVGYLKCADVSVDKAECHHPSDCLLRLEKKNYSCCDAASPQPVCLACFCTMFFVAGHDGKSQFVNVHDPVGMQTWIDGHISKGISVFKRVASAATTAAVTTTSVIGVSNGQENEGPGRETPVKKEPPSTSSSSRPTPLSSSHHTAPTSGGWRGGGGDCHRCQDDDHRRRWKLELDKTLECLQHLSDIAQSAFGKNAKRLGPEGRAWNWPTHPSPKTPTIVHEYSTWSLATILDQIRQYTLPEFDVALLYTLMNPFGKMLLVFIHNFTIMTNERGLNTPSPGGVAKGKWFNVEYAGPNLWMFQLTECLRENLPLDKLACIETLRRVPFLMTCGEKGRALAEAGDGQTQDQMRLEATVEKTDARLVFKAYCRGETLSCAGEVVSDVTQSVANMCLVLENRHFLINSEKRTVGSEVAVGECVASLEVTGFRSNHVREFRNSGRVSSRILRLLQSREGARVWLMPKHNAVILEKLSDPKLSGLAMERALARHKIFFYDIETNSKSCTDSNALIVSICGSLCIGGDTEGARRVIFALATPSVSGQSPSQLVESIKRLYPGSKKKQNKKNTTGSNSSSSRNTDDDNIDNNNDDEGGGGDDEAGSDGGGDDGKVMHPVTDHAPEEIFAFDNEFHLLLAFAKYVDAIQPHVICGWNSRSFDEPFIFTRVVKHLQRPGGEGGEIDSSVTKQSHENNMATTARHRRFLYPRSGTTYTERIQLSKLGFFHLQPFIDKRTGFLPDDVAASLLCGARAHTSNNDFFLKRLYERVGDDGYDRVAHDVKNVVDIATAATTNSGSARGGRDNTRLVNTSEWYQRIIGGCCKYIRFDLMEACAKAYKESLSEFNLNAVLLKVSKEGDHMRQTKDPIDVSYHLLGYLKLQNIDEQATVHKYCSKDVYCLGEVARATNKEGEIFRLSLDSTLPEAVVTGNLITPLCISEGAICRSMGTDRAYKRGVGIRRHSIATETKGGMVSQPLVNSIAYQTIDLSSLYPAIMVQQNICVSTFATHRQIIELRDRIVEQLMVVRNCAKPTLGIIDDANQIVMENYRPIDIVVPSWKRIDTGNRDHLLGQPLMRTRLEKRHGICFSNGTGGGVGVNAAATAATTKQTAWCVNKPPNLAIVAAGLDYFPQVSCDTELQTCARVNDDMHISPAGLEYMVSVLPLLVCKKPELASQLTAGQCQTIAQFIELLEKDFDQEADMAVIESHWTLSSETPLFSASPVSERIRDILGRTQSGRAVHEKNKQRPQEEVVVLPSRRRLVPVSQLLLPAPSPLPPPPPPPPSSPPRHSPPFSQRTERGGGGGGDYDRSSCVGGGAGGTGSGTTTLSTASVTVQRISLLLDRIFRRVNAFDSASDKSVTRWASRLIDTGMFVRTWNAKKALITGTIPNMQVRYKADRVVMQKNVKLFAKSDPKKADLNRVGEKTTKLAMNSIYGCLSLRSYTNRREIGSSAAYSAQSVALDGATGGVGGGTRHSPSGNQITEVARCVFGNIGCAIQQALPAVKQVYGDTDSIFCVHNTPGDGSLKASSRGGDGGGKLVYLVDMHLKSKLSRFIPVLVNALTKGIRYDASTDAGSPMMKIAHERLALDSLLFAKKTYHMLHWKDDSSGTNAMLRSCAIAAAADGITEAAEAALAPVDKFTSLVQRPMLSEGYVVPHNASLIFRASRATGGEKLFEFLNEEHITDATSLAKWLSASPVWIELDADVIRSLYASKMVEVENQQWIDFLTSTVIDRKRQNHYHSAITQADQAFTLYKKGAFVKKGISVSTKLKGLQSMFCRNIPLHDSDVCDDELYTQIVKNHVKNCASFTADPSMVVTSARVNKLCANTLQRLPNPLALSVNNHLNPSDPIGLHQKFLCASVVSAWCQITKSVPSGYYSSGCVRWNSDLMRGLLPCSAIKNMSVLPNTIDTVFKMIDTDKKANNDMIKLVTDVLNDSLSGLTAFSLKKGALSFNTGVIVAHALARACLLNDRQEITAAELTSPLEKKKTTNNHNNVAIMKETNMVDLRVHEQLERLIKQLQLIKTLTMKNQPSTNRLQTQMMATKKQTAAAAAVVAAAAATSAAPSPSATAALSSFPPKKTTTRKKTNLLEDMIALVEVDFGDVLRVCSNRIREHWVKCPMIRPSQGGMMDIRNAGGDCGGGDGGGGEGFFALNTNTPPTGDNLFEDDNNAKSSSPPPPPLGPGTKKPTTKDIIVVGPSPTITTTSPKNPHVNTTTTVLNHEEEKSIIDAFSVAATALIGSVKCTKTCIMASCQSLDFVLCYVLALNLENRRRLTGKSLKSVLVEKIFSKPSAVSFFSSLDDDTPQNIDTGYDDIHCLTNADLVIKMIRLVRGRNVTRGLFPRIFNADTDTLVFLFEKEHCDLKPVNMMSAEDLNSAVSSMAYSIETGTLWNLNNGEFFSKLSSAELVQADAAISGKQRCLPFVTGCYHRIAFEIAVACMAIFLLRRS